MPALPPTLKIMVSVIFFKGTISTAYETKEDTIKWMFPTTSVSGFCLFFRGYHHHHNGDLCFLTYQSCSRQCTCDAIRHDPSPVMDVLSAVLTARGTPAIERYSHAWQIIGLSWYLYIFVFALCIHDECNGCFGRLRFGKSLAGQWLPLCMITKHSSLHVCHLCPWGSSSSAVWVRPCIWEWMELWWIHFDVDFSGNVVRRDSNLITSC